MSADIYTLNPAVHVAGREVKTDSVEGKALVLAIARVAHEVNREYCMAIGDESQLPWEEAPNWQRISALEGVKNHLANPNMTPEDSHVSWMTHKAADGWTYGPEKNSGRKEHPCMVPYRQLPKEQQVKDHLFRGVVHAIAREMART